MLDLCKKVACQRKLEDQLQAIREERGRLMEHNRELADSKLRIEAMWREHADSQAHSAAAQTRSAIKLQVKRQVILRNVLAALVCTLTLL